MKKQRPGNTGFLHMLPITMSFSGSLKRKGLTSCPRKTPHLRVISSSPFFSRALFSIGEVPITLADLTSRQPINMFYFPHPCPNVPSAFLHYQPFTWKSRSTPSTLLKWFSQRSQWLPNPLAFFCVLTLSDLNSIWHLTTYFLLKFSSLKSWTPLPGLWPHYDSQTFLSLLPIKWSATEDLSWLSFILLFLCSLLQSLSQLFFFFANDF